MADTKALRSLAAAAREMRVEVRRRTAALIDQERTIGSVAHVRTDELMKKYGLDKEVG